MYKCENCSSALKYNISTGKLQCEYCNTAVVPYHFQTPQEALQETKEDCQKSYKKLFRFAPFTPQELKNPENIDNFRGIYMPYWIYSHRGDSSAKEFYADTNDVSSAVYSSDNPLDALLNTLHPSDTSTDLALFPVWFLSYRKGERIAYAAINGQTGKAAAVLP